MKSLAVLGLYRGRKLRYERSARAVADARSSNADSATSARITSSTALSVEWG